MPKKKHQTVVLDFDGVLAEYDHWRGDEHTGKPIAKALEAVRLLQYAGYDVVVSTARKNLDPVKYWMERHGFDLKVTNEKPIGVLYVDDRGLRFGGDWSETLLAIAEFFGDPTLAVGVD